MIKRFDVIGVGYCSVDFLCVVEHFPKYNTKMEVKELSRQGGGQTATAMVALARLGLNTAFVGAVGDDSLGEFSIASLAKEGVNVSNIKIRTSTTTQTAIIIIDQQFGERTILYQREEKLNLKVKDLDREFIISAKHLHIDGHEGEAALQAAKWAKEAGLSISFDAEKVRDQTEEILSLCDIVGAAEYFPERFFGKISPEKALEKLRNYGVKIATISLGERGAMGLSDEGLVHIPAFKVKVVDTTGAGDVFNAGLIFGWLNGFNLKKMLTFANAFAGLKCTDLGGRRGIPNLQKLLDFLGWKNMDVSI